MHLCKKAYVDIGNMTEGTFIYGELIIAPDKKIDNETWKLWVWNKNVNSRFHEPTISSINCEGFLTEVVIHNHIHFE